MGQRMRRGTALRLTAIRWGTALRLTARRPARFAVIGANQSGPDPVQASYVTCAGASGSRRPGTRCVQVVALPVSAGRSTGGQHASGRWL